MARFPDEENKNSRKSGKSRSGGSGGGSVSYRFVRCNPSDAEKERFEELLDAGQFSLEDLLEYLDDGYSVKFNARAEDGSYNVVISCVDSGGENYGLMLGSFAGSASVAFAFSVFKDRYLADDRQWTTLEFQSGGSLLR